MNAQMIAFLAAGSDSDLAGFYSDWHKEVKGYRPYVWPETRAALVEAIKALY